MFLSSTISTIVQQCSCLVNSGLLCFNTSSVRLQYACIAAVIKCPAIFIECLFIKYSREVAWSQMSNVFNWHYTTFILVLVFLPKEESIMESIICISWLWSVDLKSNWCQRMLFGPSWSSEHPTHAHFYTVVGIWFGIVRWAQVVKVLLQNWQSVFKDNEVSPPTLLCEDNCISRGHWLGSQGSPAVWHFVLLWSLISSNHKCSNLIGILLLRNSLQAMIQEVRLDLCLLKVIIFIMPGSPPRIIALPIWS